MRALLRPPRGRLRPRSPEDQAASRIRSPRRASIKPGGEPIFWLDADDRIPSRTRAALPALLASLGEQNVGYTMTVLGPGPDGGPMYDLRHVRLFRNLPAIRWEQRIHEQIGPAIVRSGGRIEPTPLTIVHVGYSEPGLTRAKLERNLRLIRGGTRSRPRAALAGSAGRA